VDRARLDAPAVVQGRGERGRDRAVEGDPPPGPRGDHGPREQREQVGVHVAGRYGGPYVAAVRGELDPLAVGDRAGDLLLGVEAEGQLPGAVGLTPSRAHGGSPRARWPAPGAR